MGSEDTVHNYFPRFFGAGLSPWGTRPARRSIFAANRPLPGGRPVRSCDRNASSTAASSGLRGNSFQPLTRFSIGPTEPGPSSRPATC